MIYHRYLACISLHSHSLQLKIKKDHYSDVGNTNPPPLPHSKQEMEMCAGQYDGRGGHNNWRSHTWKSGEAQPYKQGVRQSQTKLHDIKQNGRQVHTTPDLSQCYSQSCWFTYRTISLKIVTILSCLFLIAKYTDLMRIYVPVNRYHFFKLNFYLSFW